MNKHHKRMLSDSLDEIYNLNTGNQMDDKLQKMCNYLKKAKQDNLAKGGLISNANNQMDNPITSAISSAASAIGGMFGGNTDSGSGKAAGANLDRGTLDNNSGAMKDAFRKTKKI
jgi:hypothetical protein